MSRGQKYTVEEFMKKVMVTNEHVKNGEIEIRGQFIGMKKQIECFCKIHNVLWSTKAEDLFKGIGCKKCGATKTAEKRRISADAINVELERMNNGIKMVGKCMGVGALTDFQCCLGHTWKARPIDILDGIGCPYCSGKKVWIGYNDLWSTRPDVAKLLKNTDDGYQCTYGSNQKLEFVCPDCGSVTKKIVKDVCARGFCCHFCADGISYPNKFIRILLKQLNVEGVKYEWDPDWLKPYFYDNYFEWFDVAYVVEADGGLGHGKKDYRSGGQDVFGKERDIHKDALALARDINVIRIDCDYGDVTHRFEYIKNSILQSKLNILFDLSSVDWELCDKQSQKTFVVQVADLYNNGLSVAEIQNKVGYYIETIRRWLRIAAKYNLCNYNRKEAKRRTDSSIERYVNQYTLDGVFVKTYRMIADASDETGINNSSIYFCCNHYKYAKTAGGYLWFYAIDPDQPDKTKIINLTIQN